METIHPDIMAHLVDCTAAENQTCQIADKLSAMNKLLLGSMAELREHPGTSGQLHLDNTYGGPPVKDFDALKLPQYPELLPWLLRTHRCISSADVRPFLDSSAARTILENLPHNSGIKTLGLHLHKTWAMNAASTVIPCLTNIKELYCTSLIEAGDPVLNTFMTALSKLLMGSSSLESLHLVNFPLQARLADSLFTALKHQYQLKQLDLLASSLQCDTYPHDLAEYLATTTKLSVLVVDMKNYLVGKAVLEGVSKNSSIEDLFLNDFTGNQESVAIVARIISGNRVLRKLTVSTRDNTDPGMHTIYGSWIPALIENETLEKVIFPLVILHPSQWAVLFQALPTKQSLKKVHIDAAGDLHQLVPILCTELKSSRLEEKVSIRCSSFKYETDFLQCKAFSGANFFYADELALAALHVLPSCQHLTSLTMQIEAGKLGISAGLALLLESKTSLRRLTLFVGTRAEMTAGGDNRWWLLVLVALSYNDSLRELSVSLLSGSDQIRAAIAYSVRLSGSIRWVEYDDFSEDATVFVRCLAKDISKNYTLLTIDYDVDLDADFVGDWLVVQETMWRNWSLVARAARLLKASLYDRYVNAALEHVFEYPALLDEVAERVKMDQSQLAILVRDRLKKTKSLDGFMRVTGVVKDSVLCHPSDDGCIQLDVLNDDCWRHIRQYLYIDDVQEGIEPPT